MVRHLTPTACGMPNALPTPCSQPGCPERTHSRYCDLHTANKWAGDNRPSAARRGYDNRWRKVRNRYFKKNSLCESCLKDGKTVLGKDVDHIVPLPDGPRLAFSNLQTLCRTCHSRKTARETRGEGAVESL